MFEFLGVIVVGLWITWLFISVPVVALILKDHAEKLEAMKWQLRRIEEKRGRVPSPQKEDV